MSAQPPGTMAIVNPASANGTTGKVWPALSKRLTAAGLEHDARVTSRRGEASDLTRSALADGYRTIVAVGGDGTLNEVANGFFDGDRRLGQGARLGLISRGTGCDFIRTVGVPKEEEAAIEVLRTGHTRRVDVGRAVFTGHDGREAVRYFVNIAGLGLDGETVDRVNRTTKALGGFFSFLWGTLATIATYRNKDIEIVIDGGRPVKERMTLVVVANGQYFGGGMRIAPEAAVDDGLFDICTLGDCSRPELVGSLRKVYKGAHTTHPKIRFYRGKEVTVRSPDRVLLDIDGEQPGLADVTFTVLPGVLDVIVQRAGA